MRLIDTAGTLYVLMCLTLQEGGAFSKLVAIASAQGGPLPHDDKVLARMLGITPGKWRKLKPAVMRFMVDQDDGFVPELLVRPRQRTPLTKTVRLAIFERDGEVCRYCGTGEGPFDIDHIFPWIRGGSDEADNLCVACQPCNRSKGARTLEDWLL